MRIPATTAAAPADDQGVLRTSLADGSISGSSSVPVPVPVMRP